MSMKKEDLVRLMDAYMGCGGYYMKPKNNKIQVKYNSKEYPYEYH